MSKAENAKTTHIPKEGYTFLNLRADREASSFLVATFGSARFGAIFVLSALRWVFRQLASEAQAQIGSEKYERELQSLVALAQANQVLLDGSMVKASQLSLGRRVAMEFTALVHLTAEGRVRLDRSGKKVQIQADLPNEVVAYYAQAGEADVAEEKIPAGVSGLMACLLERLPGWAVQVKRAYLEDDRNRTFLGEALSETVLSAPFAAGNQLGPALLHYQSLGAAGAPKEHPLAGRFASADRLERMLLEAMCAPQTRTVRGSKTSVIEMVSTKVHKVLLGGYSNLFGDQATGFTFAIDSFLPLVKASLVEEIPSLHLDRGSLELLFRAARLTRMTPGDQAGSALRYVAEGLLAEKLTLPADKRKQVRADLQKLTRLQLCSIDILVAHLDREGITEKTWIDYFAGV